MQTFTQGNITDLRELWFQIATNLVASGTMTVESCYVGAAGSPDYSSPVTSPSPNGALYVFAPTVNLDANFELQPWRLVVKIEVNGYNIWAVTPTQIIVTPDNFRIAKVGTLPNIESGRLSPKSIEDPTDKAGTHFFSRDPLDSTWSCFEENSDADLVPLSYLVSLGDHGIAMTLWAEGQDKEGDCFNWFVIQRSVDGSGALISDSLDPLFCAFSRTGGGSNDVNVVDPNGILKFTVREKDVNAPTIAKSAVMPTADSSAWFNPIQQVSTSENGKFIVSFPRGLNTQRYRYDTELDMVAFASADAIAHGTSVPINLYGQSRKYKAINANHLNNKGMRLLIQTQL